MLASLRRKIGVITDSNAPVSSTSPPSSIAGGMAAQQGSSEYGGSQPFTVQELGFAYPSDRAVFSPNAIPVWLQEQVGWIVYHILEAYSQIIVAEFDRSELASKWVRWHFPSNSRGKWMDW
jgi:hypothetical protein